MVIFRADTNENETLMKSLQGNKIITYYIKVENAVANKKLPKSKLKGFFDKIENSLQKTPVLT